MIYGETGTTPIAVNIKNRVVAYWSRIIENISNDRIMKLSSKVYLVIYDLHSRNKVKSQWINSIKQYLCESGFSGIWYCQSFNNAKWLIKSTQMKFKDIFIQNWQAEIHQTSDTNLYKHFKNTFKRNVYFEKLPYYLSKHIIRFLTRNHRLPVEIGRWQIRHITTENALHAPISAMNIIIFLFVQNLHLTELNILMNAIEIGHVWRK